MGSGRYFFEFAGDSGADTFGSVTGTFGCGHLGTGMLVWARSFIPKLHDFFAISNSGAHPNQPHPLINQLFVFGLKNALSE